MQSIEEKIYEVFWDKNIARMINRADLFSFLKQYVNPGLLTRSSKSELVHDLKEYMTTANLEFIAERMESFGLPMVDTVSVLDTTSYAVKKLVDNDTLRIVGTFKGGNQRIPYKLCSVLDILDISHAGLLEKKQQPVLPATDENIASALYTINKSAKVSRDTKNRSYYNEYKYTHYIPNTYGNANKYHKKKLEYYQMKKVLLSILEPAHIQKGEVLQRKRTYDYEEGYEDILKSGNYVNNSGFYDPDRKEHVEFVVQMIPETVYYLTYTLSNRTFRVPLEESEIKQYPDLEVVDVGRITPVYGDITADMLSVQFVEKILLLIKNRNYTLIFENNTEQETEVKDELAAEPVSVE